MINSAQQFIQGPKIFLHGFKLILSKGYKKLFLLPVLFNTLLFVALLYGLGHSIMSAYQWAVGDYAWADFWLIKFVLWTLISIIGFFVVNTCFVFVVNLIAIPFHTKIAEKVMRDHQHPVHPLPSLWADVKQTIKRELQKNLYFLPRLAIGLVFFVIPGVNIIAPFLWLYITGWILGLQSLDYAAELQQVSWKTALANCKKNPMLVLSFGLLQCLVVTIPVFNILTPPAAVAGGCFLWHQVNKHMHAKSIETKQ